jgi:hypothetical protein
MAGFVARTREEVILKVKSALDGVGAIAKVVRRVPSYERLVELREYPQTQFPLAAIEAGLPVPDEKLSARFQGKIDLVVSALDIKINCYLLDNDEDTADTSLGSLLSTVWAALLADPTFDDYVLETRLVPNADIEFWHPFVAFQLVAKVKYTHTKGEI